SWPKRSARPASARDASGSSAATRLPDSWGEPPHDRRDPGRAPLPDDRGAVRLDGEALRCQALEGDGRRACAGARGLPQVAAPLAVRGLVGRDVVLVLQREPDLVEPLDDAVAL